MGLPRQEYWSGLPFPSPGYLPNPGIEPASPALKADSLPLSQGGNTRENYSFINGYGKIRYLHAEDCINPPHTTPVTKINSKQINDLCVRPTYVEILEENIEKILLDIGLANEI